MKPPLGIKTIEGSMGRHRRGKRGIGHGVPKWTGLVEASLMEQWSIPSSSMASEAMLDDVDKGQAEVMKVMDGALGGEGVKLAMQFTLACCLTGALSA